MAKQSSRRASEQKRAERRERDRERARWATEALLTSEGWQRWVRARAVFHSYSLQNTGPPPLRRTRLGFRGSYLLLMMGEGDTSREAASAVPH